MVTRQLDPDRGPENWRIILGLAQNHQEAIRQLWFLVDYQNYRSGVTWEAALEGIKNTIREQKGTIWTPIERRQVLGRMRQMKIAEYRDFCRFFLVITQQMLLPKPTWKPSFGVIPIILKLP